MEAGTDAKTGMNREETDIKAELISLADEEYRVFHSRLLPGTENILGVRIPDLRRLARRLLREEGASCLERLTDDTYEELQLQGLIIGGIRESAEEKFRRIREFVKKIDNWAVCDVFCGGLKFVAKRQEETLLFLRPYLLSDQEFEARFGAVMLLSYFVDEAHIGETLRLLDQVKQPGYYARMAVAWAVSVCYVKFPELTMEYLEHGNTLEDDTYNKSLQKILESCRVSREEKERIRAMKRRFRKG